MTDRSLKNYEFENCVLDNVKLFDIVLAECGEPPLLENKKFSAFQDFPITSQYLVVELITSKPNILPIMIWFEANDLVVDIAGIRETFEWSKEQINADENSVIKLIRDLFTGYVLIDNKNSSQFIQIFDSGGNFVNCSSRNSLFHMITGRFLFRFKDYRKLYLPIFTKK